MKINLCGVGEKMLKIFPKESPLAKVLTSSFVIGRAIAKEKTYK